MKKLANQQNVNAANANYPKGYTRDVAGATPGTTGGVGIFGDLIQFFQKLIIDAGITENELPDNVTNGYQLLEGANKKFNYTLKAYVTGATGAFYKVRNDANIPITLVKGPVGQYQLAGDEYDDILDEYIIQLTPINELAYSVVMWNDSDSGEFYIKTYDQNNSPADCDFYMTITKTA